ncbi:MAG: MarR family transcriptional regulator [Solirubrobacterales bacterium]|nr:MarR family transcriptional regulator [Solirubrobacterales bacterium]
MTTKPQTDSGRRSRGDTRSATTNGALDPDLEQLVATLPRRISHLSRVLYRTRGSTLPRGMRSVVFTLAFGPLRISEIAREEGIGQPAATRMVARLEALGLVVRERGSADRRVVMVALTDRGHAELDLLRAQSRRLVREALRGRSARGLRRMQAASEALALLTEWTLEQERRIEAEAKAAQSMSAGASRRSSRRALRS